MVVFPLAEHADLWKQSLQTQTEAIRLGELIEQSLAEQLCAVFIFTFTDPHPEAHQLDIIRIES